MRDAGLKLAIEAAGGVGALARGLGIRQPSVSSWVKIPADRVVAIESVTGVRREHLRPDLYANEEIDPELLAMPAAAIDEIEEARSREYLMIASLLRSVPQVETLTAIGRLGGDETPLGMARIGLAEAASRAKPADVAAEFFSLFIGIGRGELLPYASFYLTGFLHERPLARLREDMARLGIERAEGNFDPEDHLGLLMEIMAGFANGTFEVELSEQEAFFERHLAPWAERCMADIAVSPSARFYKAVAIYGMRFLEVEREAFAIGD
jgi:TorA maturation chaperone TorD